MGDVKDGGPAFPFEYDSTGFFGEPARNLHTGMTLRDWFAGMALAGLLAHSSGEDPHKAPGMAWHLADAMLNAREAGE